MPDEDKNFGGSLVLDFRKWLRHVETIYKLNTLQGLQANPKSCTTYGIHFKSRKNAAFLE